MELLTKKLKLLKGERIMIEIFYKSKKRDCYAEGVFNEKNNSVIVKKGAKITKKMDERFRISKEAKKRDDKAIVNNYILKEDILFKSPSVAAQFVSGSSLNGLKVWKTINNRPLKETIERK